MKADNNISKKDEEVKDLAKEILQFASNELIVNFRFLDSAVGNISFHENMEATFCCDGRYILYNPWFVMNMFMTDKMAVTRNLLHSLLHCIYRHNFIGDEIDKYAWNLACDIAVENSINDFEKPFLDVGRVKSQGFIDEIKQKIPVLTAERIYHWLVKAKVPNDKLQSLRIHFVGDSHSIWYSNEYSQDVYENVDTEKLWQEISRKIETELEILHGSDGALTQNLRDINRVQYDYTEFLKKFGSHRESMKISQDEFDYNYYTYGMELYGDIPLIEPLEYQDDEKISELVIAIDTSGSVKGEVVQKFIEHTHDILSRKELFSDDINLIIIQCDDRIREVKSLKSKEEFDNYLHKMKIKGFGETDFRPVFQYVDDLVETGKLKRLQGLLYFTDGQGMFPEQRPNYDVAFIINEDIIANVWTPDWAVTTYLSEDEIMDKNFARK